MSTQGKRVVLVGATGMVGGEALKLSLEHAEVSKVTVIGRRTTGVQHAKLTEVLHADFSDCDVLATVLAEQDLALYCLGVYSRVVPDAEFRKITLDATVAFAKVLREQSPQAVFCFLSGAGAHPTERSRLAFARHKGAAERALLEMSFPRLHLFRPTYIYPDPPRKEPNFGYTASRWKYPVLRHVFPGQVIPSRDLAQAMLLAGLYGTGDHLDPVIENDAIRVLAN